jgi:peroxiredoxin
MVNATDNSTETVEKAKKYVNDNGFSFPVLFDINQEAVSVYNITGFPTTYFFDADGNIIARAGGMIDYETLVKGIGMITD